MRNRTGLFMTHWEGCWKEPSHHECAVGLIEAAELVIVDMLTDAVPFAVVQEARKWMRWKNGLKWSHERQPAKTDQSVSGDSGGA